MANWITEEQRKRMEDIRDIVEIENADIDEAMIRAANKSVITSHQLLDVLVQQGVMGVYNLGLKHMYEYLKGDIS